MFTQSNILDPPQQTLTPYIFDDLNTPTPYMKPRIRQWLLDTIYEELEKFHPNAHEWATLVMTGSLTTLQYSNASDFDVSVFVNPNFLPDWDRSALIAKVVHNVDGQKVAGSPYPLQLFIVSPKITREMLYQPGIRSGYDLNTDQWIVPPDPSTVHDVQKEYNSWYVFGLETADKLKSLLKYNPTQAIEYVNYIHKKRREEEARGHGDYGLFNIAYKLLDRSGILAEAERLQQEHTASIWDVSV